MKPLAPLQTGLGADALMAAALLAVDPAGLGGAVLRARPGPGRDAWLALLGQLLPAKTPLRRIPLNTSDASLLGGLDLAATLHAGRPVVQPGVLAQADGGLVMLAMAERVPVAVAARLAAVLDTQELVMERDGLAVRQAVRLGVLALDEGASDDEQVPAALLDRLAFHLNLDGRVVPCDVPGWQVQEISAARMLLPQVVASDEILQALCAAALALGIASPRAPLLALRVARAAAALAGQSHVDEQQAALAARLVLSPRATQVPAGEEQEPSGQSEAEAEPAPSPPDAELAQAPELPADGLPQGEGPDPTATGAMQDLVLEAAQAAIPPGLLAALTIGQTGRERTQASGRSGVAQRSQVRGRPVGARPGQPRGAARLNVLETLRAAAPWQRLRRQQAGNMAPGHAAAAPAMPKSNPLQRRIDVRPEDFHITRFKQLSQTTTLFVVDASGSSALNRLAEAKGAVELLLADCYVRRDRVAVLAFRGRTAETLLPPTRSLARAKRSLAALPGGGGTPLAAGIDAALALAKLISRSGDTPLVVLLTDGRANIARDGAAGRSRANDDALSAARRFRQARLTALLLDTSPQPQASARVLAQEMGATYLPLPYAGARLLSQAVRAATLPGAGLR